MHPASIVAAYHRGCRRAVASFGFQLVTARPRLTVPAMTSSRSDRGYSPSQWLQYASALEHVRSCFVFQERKSAGLCLGTESCGLSFFL
jgi:hypothetical protein